jgi:hypothetical protein
MTVSLERSEELMNLTKFLSDWRFQLWFREYNLPDLLIESLAGVIIAGILALLIGYYLERGEIN